MALRTTTSSEPVRLFISYAREERDRVEWLAHALEGAGYKVWWDAALEGGHQFAAEITRELSAPDAVLVVWSDDAVRSNWVLDEAMVGRNYPRRYPPAGQAGSSLAG
ncbi:toll/interleukin-1 receptor domain-containing protein [Sandaracinobacteroides hominis]|uniref:toll/interleukin-1 receptor domain-containing protein n=1 Tax=Sandaracinobacteroides hominis TaxID=2780086 RepID=UPI0018F6D0E4|nr:toll/interleukin-1 receptor domain-containing protein [Sandaracinobacteroides hominis]